LGLPCALAIAHRGHDVVGFDVSPAAKGILASRKYPHREVQAQELLEQTTMSVVDTVDEVVQHADIVFIAVQTPHEPEYEGVTRMPETRADFSYTALRAAVGEVAESALRDQWLTTIVVISTCLPGSCERELYPMLENNPYASLVYNPYFIAMGTTIPDFLSPEFTLIGFDPARGNVACLHKLQNFYSSIHSAPQRVMSIASAELTKVSYNVFLGLKIVAANAVMEIAEKVNADCDDVTNALGLATDRVASAKYMRGGMGDGGGCHPRDQIALSWLARKLELSYDLFGAMVQAREAQTEWLADLCERESRGGKLPVVVLGKAYKRGTNLTVGSPAILLAGMLRERRHLDVYQWDPHVDGNAQARTFVVRGLPDTPSGEFTDKPAVYLVACDHDEFFGMNFPDGSVVIDPWGKMLPREGTKVIRVGRRASLTSPHA